MQPCGLGRDILKEFSNFSLYKALIPVAAISWPLGSWCAQIWEFTSHDACVTGKEKMHYTRLGFEPGLDEFSVKCSINQAICPPVIEPG